MKREPGFYWVNHRGTWVVALYDGYEWLLPGSRPTDRDDTGLDAIHETRLIPPKEQQRQHLIDLMKKDEESGMYEEN